MDYWRDGILKGLTYWIWDLQSLVAGLLALAAAAITSYFLWKQITQNHKFREEDRITQMKTDVMLFCSEYAEMVNGVLNFYKTLKQNIPEGYNDDLWIIMPKMLELEREFLNISKSAAKVFRGETGGELFSELLILQETRNRLASSIKQWNLMNSEGETLFQGVTRVHEKTGRLVADFDSSNPRHRGFQIKAERLLESMVFMAEDQVRDIISIQPKLMSYLSSRINDPNFKGYVVKDTYIDWFKKNSSDV